MGGWYQGDVFEHEGSLWVVVSRSCDIVRDSARTPNVFIAPLTERADRESLEGRNPRWAPLPDYDGGGYGADLEGLRQIPKEELVGKQGDSGCNTPAGELTFRRAAGRFFARPSHHDSVEKTLAPMADQMKRRSGKDSPEGRLIDVITDVRLEIDPALDPHDHSSEREIHVWFIVSADALLVEPDEGPVQPLKSAVALRKALRDKPPREQLSKMAEQWEAAPGDASGAKEYWLSRYLELLMENCKCVSPVVKVTWDLRGEDDFTLAEMRITAPLTIEDLSFGNH